MRKTLYTLALLFPLFSLAQTGDPGRNMQVAGGSTFNNNGETIYTQRYGKNGEGTPFYLVEYLKADFVLFNGKVDKQDAVRIDLFNNAIFYLDSAGNEMACISKLKGLILYDTVNHQTHKLVHYSAMPKYPNGLLEGWYVLVQSGNPGLYKKVIKKQTDPGTQRSSLSELSMSTSYAYFLNVNDTLHEVTKIKLLPGFLPDKKEKLEKFIHDNKLKGREEEDYLRVLAEYSKN